ncbi:unnamed protein product [Lampetra fluviatilis]
MLQAACQQMTAVFEPSSRARFKFSTRRREEGESLLAFRCALLALAQATYPDLEGKGLDSLALDRLLALMAELGIVLSIPEEAKITSLAVVHNMQFHLALRCPAVVAACASVPLPAAPAAGVATQGGGTFAAVAIFDRQPPQVKPAASGRTGGGCRQRTWVRRAIRLFRRWPARGCIAGAPTDGAARGAYTGGCASGAPASCRHAASSDGRGSTGWRAGGSHTLEGHVYPLTAGGGPASPFPTLVASFHGPGGALS